MYRCNRTGKAYPGSSQEHTCGCLRVGKGEARQVLHDASLQSRLIKSVNSQNPDMTVFDWPQRKRWPEHTCLLRSHACTTFMPTAPVSAFSKDVWWPGGGAPAWQVACSVSVSYETPTARHCQSEPEIQVQILAGASGALWRSIFGISSKCGQCRTLSDMHNQRRAQVRISAGKSDSRTDPA